MSKGNPPEFWDYIDLALLHLAKIGRRKLVSSDGTSEFYEEFFNENDVEVMTLGADLRRQARAETLTQAAWARMPIGGRVLDVGCGTGDNLRYVYRGDTQFFGLEYADTTAIIAQRLLTGKAKVAVGSAKQIPYPSDSFDLVLCIEVLEHVDGDKAACAEIHRVMKPGGALVLSLPYRHWFPSYYNLMGHIRHYTKTEVEELLGASGLEVVDYLPNFPRWSRFANYIYILCRILALSLRLIGIRRAPTHITLPFTRRPVMDLLFQAIEPLRSRDGRLDYPNRESSTFVVAVKQTA